MKPRAFLKAHRLKLILLGLALLAIGAASWFQAGHCRDMSCIKSRNIWFKDRYDATVPVFLSGQYAQRLLPPSTDANMREAVSETLDRLAARALSTEERLMKKRPLSCAVVGNSGNLRASGYGEKIDAHSLVFRMNNAPVRSYEADVGSRTTHHVMSSHVDWRNGYAKDTVSILIMDDTHNFQRLPYADKEGYTRKMQQVLYWLAGKYTPEKAPAAASPFLTHTAYFQAPGGIKLMSPDFIRYIRHNWFRVEESQDFKMPSIGFKTIVLAFHLCDSVDLFGFGINQKTQQWDHYYDEGFPITGVAMHRAGYQEQFLSELEENKVVRIYKGNVDRFELAHDIQDDITESQPKDDEPAQGEGAQDMPLENTQPPLPAEAH